MKRPLKGAAFFVLVTCDTSVVLVMSPVTPMVMMVLMNIDPFTHHLTTAIIIGQGRTSRRAHSRSHNGASLPTNLAANRRASRAANARTKHIFHRACQGHNGHGQAQGQRGYD